MAFYENQTVGTGDPDLSAFQAPRARLEECRLAFSSAGLALVKAQEDYDRVVREYLEVMRKDGRNGTG